MTPNISIEALKEMKIGEICELVKQAERLPEPSNRLVFMNSQLNKPKIQTVQELLDELNMEEIKS